MVMMPKSQKGMPIPDQEMTPSQDMELRPSLACALNSKFPKNPGSTSMTTKHPLDTPTTRYLSAREISQMRERDEAMNNANAVY